MAGLRADAEQNRTRILAAARAALAASGDASLHSIAQRAGVGQGTLYRHFANREELVLAVYRHDVTELVDAAPALLAAHPPGQALEMWFEQLAVFGRVKHGVSGVLHAAAKAGLDSEHYQPVVGAIALLLRAGQDAGQLRPDADAAEVLQLVSFLWRDEADPAWQARSRHMLRIVLDGLRA